jgi:phenylacetate-CoA ligase
VGRLFGRRVVLHYHGGAAEPFFARWGMLAKLAVLLANRLVVPSAFLKEVFHQKFHLDAAIIPNVLDLDLFKFTPRDGLSPKLIAARHLEPVYDVACALRAFAVVLARYPEATLDVAGGGSEKRRLEKLAEALGCAEAVAFRGAVPNREILSLFRNSDIYLNSSRVDNMPVSILEAFASGLPVVTTRAGGIPHIVKHKENGLLVDVGDHEGLAAGVIWLLEHQAQARQLAVRAREYVEACTWERVRSLLFDVYGWSS